MEPGGKGATDDGLLGVFGISGTLHDDLLVALFVDSSRTELTLIALLIQSPGMVVKYLGTNKARCHPPGTVTHHIKSEQREQKVNWRKNVATN